MSSYDETDALVLPGARVLTRPGVTLITAPVAGPSASPPALPSPPSPQPASTSPSAPGLHPIQPQPAATDALVPPGVTLITAPVNGATTAQRVPSAVDGAANAPGKATVAARKRAVVAAIAESQIGENYRWGGTSPATGFDCSGLVQWAYAHIGVTLPRTSEEQYAYAQRRGTWVPPNKLQRGDLVFYRGSGPFPGHVGIYVGNGKVMQALSQKYGVGVWPVGFVGGYVAAYRIVKR